MAPYLHVVLFAFCLISSISYTFGHCNLPSKFWCNSAEIAFKCGVYEQCKRNEWSLQRDPQLVNITLYFESLCPDCKNFITKMLYPSWQKVGSIMNLKLVPYGNAEEKQVGDHWEFDCQHGKEECIGNIIETCTIAIVQKISVYFPFINCMESSAARPEDAAKVCAKRFPVPLDQILKCSNSSLGNSLEHEMAVETDALVPKHQYVPWVTLNGVHTEEIEKEAEADLVKLVCDTYKVTVVSDLTLLGNQATSMHTRPSGPQSQQGLTTGQQGLTGGQQGLTAGHYFDHFAFKPH